MTAACGFCRAPRPDEPLTFRLPPGAIKTVGRAPRADFIVDAALVSRLHCRLDAPATTRWRSSTSTSTNGTFVNDKRVERGTAARAATGCASGASS